MPSGITQNDNAVEEINIKEPPQSDSTNNTEVVSHPCVQPKSEEVYDSAKLNPHKVEENKKKVQKRVHEYHELWSDPEIDRNGKRMKFEGKNQIDDLPLQTPTEQFGNIGSRKKRKFIVNSTIFTMQKACKPAAKPACKPARARPACKSSSRRAKKSHGLGSCRKPYYRKRRYCCPGQRRYKAKHRCCSKKFNRNRINICNRNWARISINPFINFLRIFRRKFCKGTSPTEIARKGRAEWKKMTCNAKKKFYEQAKRARIRGYRT